MNIRIHNLLSIQLLLLQYSLTIFAMFTTEHEATPYPTDAPSIFSFLKDKLGLNGTFPSSFEKNLLDMSTGLENLNISICDIESFCDNGKNVKSDEEDLTESIVTLMEEFHALPEQVEPETESSQNFLQYIDAQTMASWMNWMVRIIDGIRSTGILLIHDPISWLRTEEGKLHYEASCAIYAMRNNPDIIEFAKSPYAQPFYESLQKQEIMDRALNGLKYLERIRLLMFIKAYEKAHYQA